MADQQQRFALDKRALLAEKAQEVRLFVRYRIDDNRTFPALPVLANDVGLCSSDVHQTTAKFPSLHLTCCGVILHAQGTCLLAVSRLSYE